MSATAEGSFKFGINNTAGYAAYINNGTAFVKHYEHVIGGTYPDHGVSFETYTNDKFIEMETLGQLRDLLPDDTTSNTEHWALYKAAKAPSPKNEAAMKKLTARIFK